MESSLQRLLSLRQLRLVAVLGRELNLSRCAIALHTTQPAASRALAQLEKVLGTRLFDRTTKRMTATPAGMSLIHHAERILAEIDIAEESLAGLRGGISGEVRVGMLPAFSSRCAARAIERAGEMLPDVLFSCQGGDAAVLLDELLNRRLDVVLCHAELPIDLNLVEVTPLYEERSVVLAAPSHRFAGRRRLTWADIAGEPWVLPPRSTPLRPKLDRLLAVHRSGNARRRPDVHADSVAVALELLGAAGMLWAHSSRQAAGFEAAGLARRLFMPGQILSGPMCAFRLREEPLSAPLRLFLQCLAEACAAETPAGAGTPADPVARGRGRKEGSGPGEPAP